MSTISPNTLQVPAGSRYVGTPVYSQTVTQTDEATGTSTSRKAAFFGVWSPPNVIARNREVEHIVSPDEEFRPELISFRIYSDKSLFWAIALRNAIVDIFESLKAGARLTCPHIDDITAALSQGSTTRPNDL